MTKLKPKILLLIILYYIGNFVLLPYLFIRISSSLQLPGFDNSMLSFIGACMVIIGVVNSIYCYRVFLKGGEGTPMSTQPTQKIIVHGPFKYTRNPLYLGQFVIILGEFLWFGEYALMVYFVVFVTVYHFIVIPSEEAKTEERLGGLYKEYKKSVPKYLVM